MSIIPLYQTIENKELDEIENNGPFLCNKNNAWLGEGCYFWEDNIENAHWWGRNYPKGYVICKSSYDYDNKNFFDFQDLNNLNEFRKSIELLQNKYNIKNIRVPFVLEFMKKQDDFKKKYKAIRCYPLNQDSKEKIYFKKYGKSNVRNPFIDLHPPIQICVFQSSFLNSKYEICFPECYAKNYVL